MNSCAKYASYLLLVILINIPVLVSANNADPELQRSAQKIVHILDYIAVEYGNIVQDGRITDQDEYEEQREFSQQLTLLVNLLPQAADISVMKVYAHQLSQTIEQRGTGDKVAELCNIMSLKIIEMFQVGVAPRVAPKLENADKLFLENCAVCHGEQGYGDGPRAAVLQPAPANFHDRERQQHRSVFSLYNTISLGVDGTAMPAFSELTSQQRWQLAFYVSNFFASDVERAKGEAFLAETKSRPAIKNLRQLAQTTPAQVAGEYGADSMAELAYLRSKPAELQEQTIAPLQVAEDSLRASLLAYQNGDKQSAYDLAVAAYLDGFELAEVRLDSADPELRQQIESAMLQYRDMIKHDASIVEVQEAHKKIAELLSSAHQTLHTSNLSSSVNFLSALLTLLREGVEAILILAAISAVLIKTGRSDMIRYIHYGWIFALLLGGITWFVAGHFLNISGANREMTEGITALASAAMLIYVGFWLHKQTYAMHWQHFIRVKVSSSLTNSALTGLAAVAFIAVYREVFESILFFHTLWLQTNPEGHNQILSGMITAAVLLVLIAWGVFKFSVRLPLKLFFRVNSVFLYLLAIVFAGKGIAALQEAGKLRVDPVHFFEIDALGIFPNLESLGIQAMMIAIAVSLYIMSRIKVNHEKVENEA
jgi:high-affinity iron transporter